MNRFLSGKLKGLNKVDRIALGIYSNLFVHSPFVYTRRYNTQTQISSTPTATFFDRYPVPDDLTRALPQITKDSVPTTIAGPELRTYQQECIHTCLTAFSQNKRRIAVSLATGGGKTMIFTHLIHHVKSLNQGDKVLIIAHRKELVQQAYATASKVYPTYSIEIEMGKQRASGNSDITIASIQTLIRSNRMEKFDPSQFKMIIIDEAHHAAARSYLNVLEYFNATDEKTLTYIVGFSATLERLDGLKLGKAMDHVVYNRGVVDMIESGHLCDIRVTTVKIDIDFKNVDIKSGDFELGSLGKAVNVEGINDLVCKSWKHQITVGGYKSTLAFCVNIQHVLSLSETFRANGVHSEYLTADTPSDHRARILRDFKDGKFPVLINCGILTEGTDIPNIDCILLVRPTKSRALLTQMIGRGLRLYNNKKHCHIVDFVGITNNGVCTVPTLIGLDPDEILDNAQLLELSDGFQDLNPEKSTKKISEKAKAITKDIALFCHLPGINPTTVTLETFEGVMQFMKSTNLYPSTNYVPINQSQFSWIKTVAGKYVLSTPQTYLLLEQVEDKSFQLHKYTRIPIAIEEGSSTKKRHDPLIKREIFTGIKDPVLALNSADTLAKNTFARSLIARSAPWRMQPATPEQKKLIRKQLEKMTSTKTFKQTLEKLGKSADFKDDFNWIEKLTKGQGSDFLSRTKFGSMSSLMREYVNRFAKVQAKIKSGL